MILVNSSVWIDYFNGIRTAATDRLDPLLGCEELAVGDLILAEVLLGFASAREALIAERLFGSLEVVEIANRDIAIRAAKNFRLLRRKGVTVRKTIDTLIATRCVESGHELLYDDRDFDPFVKHLGLRAAI